MQPVAPAADVGQEEVHAGVSPGKCAELHGIRRLLSRPVAPPVLPDVVEDGHAALGREPADRIEQRIVRAAARGELDADHSGIQAAVDLRQRGLGVIGVHRHVPADPRGVAALELEQPVVGVAQIGNGREVGGRRGPPTAQDRRHVAGDADPVTRAQPAGVSGLPVGARGAVMEKMRVHVDEHARLPLLGVVRALVRRGRAAQGDLVGTTDMELQVGVLPGSRLDGAILIVDVVEIVDGRFSRGHATSVVRVFGHRPDESCRTDREVNEKS